jgi:hypothetical protein
MMTNQIELENVVSEINSCRLGSVFILDLYGVYMTKVVNSLDENTNGYLRCLASKIFAPLVKSSVECYMYERMHQTVENVLRILVHGNPPKNMSKAKDIVDDALATAMHIMRTTVASLFQEIWF